MRLWIVACLALALALPGLAQAEQNFIGQVKKAAGMVEMLRNGKQMAVKPGQVLLKGDVIITGADGSVGIIFSDDSGISLGPNSQMTMKDYAFDPARDKLSFWAKLKQGTMVYFSGVIAKLRRNRVMVETPTVTMGVRGTRFAVKVD